MKVHISRDVIFEEGRKWKWEVNDDVNDEGQFCFSTLLDLAADNFD